MQGSKDLRNGTAVVKTEPGTSTQRLPSLKGRRDLSLSSDPTKILKNPILKNATQTKKTVYMPCLNVQRNRPQAITIKQEPRENKPRTNLSERGRPNRRGRGNLIQLGSGTFEEGRGPSIRASRGGRYSCGSGGGGDGPSERAVLQVPKLTKQENIKINKEEEEMMLKELLRDDFVDNPTLEPDYDYCPVKLPLAESNIFACDNVKKIKTETGTSGEGDFKIPSGIKIKVEPGLEDDIKDKLTEIKLDVDHHIKKEKKLPTVREIMSSKEQHFVMLQLPSCLPGLKPEVADSSVRHNQPTSSQNNGLTSGSSNLPVEQPSSKSGSEPQCTLQSLRPGKIGKMQVLKSGRVRLILGDTKLWLEMGTQVSFKQDLISIDLDRKTKTGKTICMGSVPLRMTVTPDWEHLLSTRTMS